MDAVPPIADLDRPSPLVLIPAVFAANLAALREVAPQLAELVQSQRLPFAWRPVVGIDGSPTWRLEPEGAAPQWLALTAAPQTRAEGLLRAFQPGNGNVGLPGISAGAELVRLIEVLPVTRAIFVFERDPRALALVLRQRDLSAEIRTRRCVILKPNDFENDLAACLASQPGLLPPTALLRLPDVDDAWTNAASELCQRVGGRALAERAARTARLTTAVREAPQADSREAGVLRRIAISATRPAHAPLAEALVAAAPEAGLSASAATVRGPADVGILSRLELLAAPPPDLVISIAGEPGALEDALPAEHAEWRLSGVAPLAADSSQQLWRLAASPLIEALLYEVGVDRRRVLPLHWPLLMDPQRMHPPERRPTCDDVIVVGDLPNDDPAACGIDQPTHQQLWGVLQQRVERDWGMPLVLAPDELLHATERQAGVRIGDEQLRSQLVRILRHALIVARVRRTILRVLTDLGQPVVSLGQGWSVLSGAHSTDDVANPLGERGTGPRPRAAVFTAVPDPLSPAILCAAARGWPLLLHSPAPSRTADWLGDVLRPGEHYLAFRNADELRNVLRQLGNAPHETAARVQRAYEAVLSKATAGARLGALADAWRAAHATSERK